MGEVLHVVDFEQLKIEHEQYADKLDTKTKELKRLKITTGRLIQTVNDMKEVLSAQVRTPRHCHVCVASA